MNINYYELSSWKAEWEHSTPVDWIKVFVENSKKVTLYNRYLMKVGGYNSRNIVNITIKMSSNIKVYDDVNASSKKKKFWHKLS